MNWVCQTPPVNAYGTGGRKVRVDAGDCWDHFTVHFKYPNNVGMVFSSRQFEAHGSQPDGIVCRVFGSKGVLETKYGGNVMIRGQNFYRGGDTKQIYRDGLSTMSSHSMTPSRRGLLQSDGRAERAELHHHHHGTQGRIYREYRYMG